MGYDYYYTDDIEKEINSLNSKNARPANYGLAVAALVLGIVSLVFFLFILNFFTAIAGIIIGIVFLASSRGYKKGRGLAIIGIIASILSIVFCIGSYMVIFENADNVTNMMEQELINNPGIYYDLPDDTL